MLNFFKIVPFTNYIKHKNNIIAYCNNAAYIVFCYIDEVQICSKDWECITLKIKEVKLCCIPEDSDCLILLCQNSITSKIALNVYNISNQFKHKTANTLCNTILECNSKVTALSALNTSDSQLCLSIGLDNGNILFYNNVIYKDISTNAFKCLNVNTKPIKGIMFSKNKKDINMFVCSDAGVFCYTICKNFILSETKFILDDMASIVHCSTLKASIELGGEQYFVVARDDGLYCYTADGRGPCYPINGHKQTVECFGKSLIIVLKTNGSLYLQGSTSQLIIVDIDNKIIVLNKEFDEVLCVLPRTCWSGCLILLKNGDVFTLKEHELRFKLSLLIKKNLYDIALKFLQESTPSTDIMSEVLVHYGDYLLQRGDTLEAVKVYSKTIGTTSPFSIINKLMDFRYNEHLIQYLSNLVQTEYKMAEHVELLNNCFQRIELPASAIRIFEIEVSKYHELYAENATINKGEKIKMILKSLLQKQNVPVNVFNELKNSEVLNFFSEYGYCLIKKYPNELKELINYLLSNRFLKNHIFHNIILSLSLTNKLCAIDFINKIFKDCGQNSIYNIWTELILQMWHKGHIDINFVIEFFKIHESEICFDNVFILCRNYKFWPGIRLMYDKCSMEILSTSCLVNSFDMFPGYMNTFSIEYSGQKLNYMWIRTIQKEKLATNYSLKFVSDIVRNIINANPYYIINILYSFVISNDFLLSHLNEILLHENFFTHFKCDELYSIVLLLKERVGHMEDILHKYLNRPIEFRNRSCDICKQMIKQPAVYFLCQHSYHRECIRQYSEVLVCIVCTDIQMFKLKINDANQINNPPGICNKIKNTLLMDISKKMGQLPLKSADKELNTKDMQKNALEYDLKSDKNPFSEYDANLNPFNN
ncbi:vacuolar protein sorting-associated protein 11 homolog [Calliphora vicina]|uniref:vacuolar protein sorting-associated protein 11 homolog n=1 Tax=Calliphora vicina TaxID=7373 RepID=UPI00325BECB2